MILFYKMLSMSVKYLKIGYQKGAPTPRWMISGIRYRLSYIVLY